MQSEDIVVRSIFSADKSVFDDIVRYISDTEAQITEFLKSLDNESENYLCLKDLINVLQKQKIMFPNFRAKLCYFDDDFLNTFEADLNGATYVSRITKENTYKHLRKFIDLAKSLKINLNEFATTIEPTPMRNILKNYKDAIAKMDLNIRAKFLIEILLIDSAINEAQTGLQRARRIAVEDFNVFRYSSSVLIHHAREILISVRTARQELEHDNNTEGNNENPFGHSNGRYSSDTTSECME